MVAAQGIAESEEWKKQIADASTDALREAAEDNAEVAEEQRDDADVEEDVSDGLHENEAEYHIKMKLDPTAKAARLMTMHWKRLRRRWGCSWAKRGIDQMQFHGNRAGPLAVLTGFIGWRCG